MNLKPEKPVPYYTSLYHTRQKLFWSKSVEDGFGPDEWPCNHCGGRGKVRDPEDRDVVEGYKMAPFYTCGHCDNGRVHKSVVKAIYDHEKETFKLKMQKYKEKLAIIRSIKSKLTKKEWEYLTK